MSKENGLVPREQIGVSMTELSRLNGADSATKVNTARDSKVGDRPSPSLPAGVYDVV